MAPRCVAGLQNAHARCLHLGVGEGSGKIQRSLGGFWSAKCRRSVRIAARSQPPCRRLSAATCHRSFSPRHEATHLLHSLQLSSARPPKHGSHLFRCNPSSSAIAFSLSSYWEQSTPVLDYAVNRSTPRGRCSMRKKRDRSTASLALKSISNANCDLAPSPICSPSSSSRPSPSSSSSMTSSSRSSLRRAVSKVSSSSSSSRSSSRTSSSSASSSATSTFRGKSIGAVATIIPIVDDDEEGGATSPAFEPSPSPPSPSPPSPPPSLSPSSPAPAPVSAMQMASPSPRASENMRDETGVREIRVCTNRTCRKEGSLSTLQLFRELAPPAMVVESCGCLGRCGAGPNLTLVPTGTLISHCSTASHVARLLERQCGAHDPDRNLQALDLKHQGIAAFERGDAGLASQLFSKAISLGPSGGMQFLLANRAAARIRLGDYQAALEDAHVAAQMAPTWSGAYLRMAEAQLALGKLDDVASSYEQAVRVDPSLSQSRSYQGKLRNLKAQLAGQKKGF